MSKTLPNCPLKLWNFDTSKCEPKIYKSVIGSNSEMKNQNLGMVLEIKEGQDLWAILFRDVFTT